MTREEEIINAASEYGCLDKGETLLAFTEGAKWADKNPKRYSQDELCDIQLEMMKQRDKRLIEKACKYLKSLTYQEFAGGLLERVLDDYEIEEFKKALEE